MAIAVVYRPPAMSVEQYRKSWAAGPPVAPPPGLIVHAGIGEGPDFFTVTVWESRAAYDAFAPAFAETMSRLGLRFGEPQILPVHQLLPPVESMKPQTSPQAHPPAFIAVHGFRYQVKDVERAVAFYTRHLGFTLKHQQLPAFANVSLGNADVLLSGPGASGSRDMPNGERQQPGGWNRIVLQVTDLPACIAALRQAGVTLRNEMEVGPGGRQVQIEDPDGNPVELFEPASRS